MAALAVARVGLFKTEQRLLVAPAAAVDRDGDDCGALLLRALNMVLGDLELVGGVELVPDRLAARRDHVLDRGGGLGGQDLQVVSGLGGPGHAFLTVRMIAFVAAGRRNDDRAV